MTRKSISTSAPVQTCDVCGRTLLRGENADVFLHGGARRVVCELCTKRAAHEGWIREGLDDATVRSDRPNGRSRGLLDRLRQRRAAEHQEPDAPEAGAPAPGPKAAPAEPVTALRPAPAPVPEPVRQSRSVHAIPTNADLKMARALDLFNASAHRRTVAGVARSLGAPVVAVRPSATEGSVVTIVVSWELSWYRFEVDLGNEAAGVRITAQGAELAELEPADQLPNAAADELGELHLVVQHA